MLKDYTIIEINDILRRNKIPWLFSQDSIGNNDEFNRDFSSDRPINNELGIGRMCWEAFERETVKDILIDLRKAIDYM